MDDLLELKLLNNEPQRAENVSIKLIPKYIEALDAVASKAGKSRGVTARIILEQGILDIAKKWGFYPEDIHGFYDGLTKVEITKP